MEETGGGVFLEGSKRNNGIEMVIISNNSKMSTLASLSITRLQLAHKIKSLAKTGDKEISTPTPYCSW